LKTATTLEFRSAVRHAAHLLGVTLGTSWTEGANVSGSGSRRYVGFQAMNSARLVAVTTEILLNDRGLTAKTRGGDLYVRGTCRLAR